MANSKISALTSATTPLAGTETLPIVQSGATVKVANNDLRPKQIQSNATSGVLQVAGPAAASTRVMTTPDANFTAARTDAAQSFTGDQTLSTGSLIFSTSGKGIQGTTTNDTANAGVVGEYISASATYGAYTSGFVSITSVSLKAGDWDVGCFAALNQPTGQSLFDYIQFGLSTSNATLTGYNTNYTNNYVPASAIAYYIDFQASPGLQRISLSATTTIYLVFRAGFTAGTLSLYGFIRARRVR